MSEAMPQDYPIVNLPAFPGANGDLMLIDPDNPPDGMPSLLAIARGCRGTVLFDQAVTLFVEEWRPATSTYVPLNNNGAGDAVAANTVWPIAVGFGGTKTRIRVRFGGTPPTLNGSLLAYRLTSKWPVSQ